MILKRISLDDWEGYYLDGKLIAQNHSVDVDEILQKLNIPFESKYIEDENNLDEFGNSLPDDLKTIEEYITKNNL